VLGSVVDDTNDRKLMRRINYISEAVYGYTRREWLPITASATRSFVYSGYGMVNLAPYDLRAATQVRAWMDYPTAYQFTLAAGDATTLGDYRLRPVGGLEPATTYQWIEFGVHPYTQQPLWAYDIGFHDFKGRYEVQVTGSWGIGVVPDDVKLAVLIALENSYTLPGGEATRTLGPLAISEPVETDVTSDAIWRALPGESRALLSRYREDLVAIG
jgi:hypothetical protein